MPGDFERGRARQAQSRSRAARRRDAQSFGDSHPALRAARRARQGSPSGGLAGRARPAALRLRHQRARSGEGDLATIEEEINARIRENAAVATEEMAYDDAIKAGALAFFGDKYGDVVRVVRMGDFSVELCGGTHVNRTGDIGFFKLEAESGVAAGVRRIEALTGQGALEAIRSREKILEDIGGHLGARDDAAVERLERLLAREKELGEKATRARTEAGGGRRRGAAATDERVREANGVKVVTRKRRRRRAARVARDGRPDAPEIWLRGRRARLRPRRQQGRTAGRRDAGPASRIKAGDIIKQIAPIVGGTGGGRPDFAQAGGRDPSQLDEALERVVALVA